MEPIELYAELLTNIRTVTLVASLKSDSNCETKAEISADGQSITINHEAHSATIRLPTQMTGGGTAALTLPAMPSKDLTLRLQLEEKSPGLLKFENGSENLVPWPSSAMGDGVQCRGCGVALSREGAVSEWKDLPNENWAEMMDFWHCHKPHEHDHKHDDNAANSKGYSSSNKLAAKPGIGLVGLSYLLLMADDCASIKANEKEISSSDDSASLLCTSCDAVIGVVDEGADGWKLYKWSLQLRKEGGVVESFAVSKWISTQLLAAIENSGVRRFVVEPSTSQSQSSGGLLLWIFTDDLCFSSSVDRHSRCDPTRAMKIFYKSIDNPKEVIEKNQFSHEQLTFPTNIFEQLKQSLVESAKLLPSSARKFQDWNVGMLERFGEEDLKGLDVSVAPTPEMEVQSKEGAEKEGKGEVSIEDIPNSSALLE
ncbi:hypothetical protein EJ08DRAFT_580048 [Tothia fuscella]|uniref:Ubiquitin-conjugating enzyme E2C-binding protein n=1 Tax=Tothia fuscella TaxID=1048955 RepID=A0A9P4P226_9PEZI|nr:hypothetical protein EJ08DRAFT_580048 [Tothia fuscella]